MPVITLLHTSDLQASFDRMTRLATLIQRERAQAHDEGRPLLLLDAGDSSSAEVWESEVTRGRANYAMLEAMGYDAAVIGDRDRQWGRGALNKLLASLHFALLAANLRDAATGTPAPGLRGEAVFKFKGLSVGIVGLTGGQDSHPDFQVVDPVQTLQALVPGLGAGVLIVLSHLGLEADAQLAASVPGIHAILGGHGPTPLPEPIRVGEAAIVQTGEHAQSLGRLDLSVDPETGRLSVSHFRLIPCTDATPPEPTLAGMLELIRFEANVLRKKAQRNS